ncbi:hypothetical protein Avbf_09129 [Armadillidium vulgare]|nr:hypothetical protein Avbf_09129 [Armadillidium vulgare]
MVSFYLAIQLGAIQSSAKNFIHSPHCGLSSPLTTVEAFSLVDDIKLYNIIICGWGLGIGSTIALNVMVMIEVMGIEMLPTVLGVAALFQGFGGITLGTLVGVIRDATSSYTYSLWMLGGCEFVAFLLWLLMPCAQKYDEKKYPKDKGQREDSEITKCY